MRKCQFSQVNSIIYTLLIIGCFSYFYALCEGWEDKNLLMQEFSDLKTAVYEADSTGMEAVVFFSKGVDIVAEDNAVYLGNYSKDFDNIVLRGCVLSNVTRAIVSREYGEVVIE